MVITLDSDALARSSTGCASSSNFSRVIVHVTLTLEFTVW